MLRGYKTTFLLFVVMVFLSLSANAESFVFRNGISFGMNEDSIIKIEETNNQISADEWYRGNISAGYILQSGVKVKVSSYDATIFYFFSDGKMEAAWYDLYVADDETKKYETIFNAISSVYGEGEPIEAGKIVRLMDFFAPGILNASDVKESRVWQRENVVIYQFYYDTNSFIVIYSDPSYKYENVDITGI